MSGEWNERTKKHTFLVYIYTLNPCKEQKLRMKSDFGEKLKPFHVILWICVCAKLIVDCVNSIFGAKFPKKRTAW